MASSKAQAFFNRQSPAQQAEIRASWNGADLMDEWYSNAAAAGSVPGEGTTPDRSLLEQNLTQGQTTGDEIRDPAYSKDQWGAWEKEERDRQGQAGNAYNTANKYNPDGKSGCPPNLAFTSRPGPDGKVECSAKPGDCPDGSGLHGSSCKDNDWLNQTLGGDRPSSSSMGASWVKDGANPFAGSGGGPGSGGGGGQGGGPPPPPPPPTTFGSQLSYTGNPLTDMLLYQFNSGSQLSDPSKMNTFALGEDRQEGGTGADADAGARTGQLLQGGGLWWQGPQEKGQDAFGGFRADTANAAPAGAAAAAPTAPAPAPRPAPTVAQSPGAVQALPNVSQPPPTDMSDMLGDSFKPRRSWRNKADGADSPFEAQAF
jgi:hypothetical protein